MKKLLFGLTAAAAMVACAEDITSGNVVGYTTKALRNGATMLAPCFKDVSADKTAIKMDLTSIVVEGYDKEEGTFGDVIVQILGAGGKTTDQYFWYDVTEDGETIKCWFDKNDEVVEPGDVEFSAGDGLWVTGKNGLSLTFPGEVNFSDVTVNLRNGATPTGNMMTTAKDITAIEVSGYDKAEGTYGDVIVQILGAGGKTTDQYFWYDVTEDGETTQCWFDKNDEPVEEGQVSFQPGDGLWVTGKNGLKLNVAAPAMPTDAE